MRLCNNRLRLDLKTSICSVSLLKTRDCDRSRCSRMLERWIVVKICWAEYTRGCVHAIRCVNKRDVHVAQSAIAQTETINHKCTESCIALLQVPQVLFLGWNYTALYLQHCISWDFVLTLRHMKWNASMQCHVNSNYDKRG